MWAGPSFVEAVVGGADELLNGRLEREDLMVDKSFTGVRSQVISL